MPLVRWMIGCWLLVACGDNKPANAIHDAAAIPDAPTDARPDANVFGNECRASSDCLLTEPICCVLAHAGGELDYHCNGVGQCPQGAEVACRGSGDRCHVLSGENGMCTMHTIPVIDHPY